MKDKPHACRFEASNTQVARHGVDPFANLRDVLLGISHHPASHVVALTPAYWRSVTN